MYIYIYIYIYTGFSFIFHGHRRCTGQPGKGGDHPFLSPPFPPAHKYSDTYLRLRD